MAVLHKYSGAGNDFVVLDGRTEDVSAYRETARIAALCRQYGTDGLMILTSDPEYDFRMEFYNPDGSGGMMCGNGGRCITAFADELGLRPADGRVFRFAAADGVHTGEILSRAGGCKTVRLRMIDVREFYPVLDGWFLDTGTRHFVRFVPDAEAVDVETEGRALRWDPIFAPVGANANFVSVDPDGTLRVRTFEKGVEGETLACGTGITASAIAAYLVGLAAESSRRADRNYFSHQSPTYGSPFEMMKSFGIRYSAAGENIAKGYTSPQSVVDGWMNSQGHRENILNSVYTQIGVGYYPYGNYWTQMFIG